MGGNTPRAVVPPPVIYYPPPAEPSVAPSETPGDTSGEQREKNLLRRARSTLGTILNGFRGILLPGANTTPRKTLLGE